jgi:hypothetical protein
MEIDRDTEGCAWMAGNCLGYDWPEARGARVLARVVQRARFAAGRTAAVNGLSGIAQRTQSRQRHARMVAVIEDVASNDRSRWVRAAACNVRRLAAGWLGSICRAKS